MRRIPRRLPRWILLAAAAGLSTGCAGGGNRFSLFPPSQQLIPQARELRAAYPEPLALPRELDKKVTPPYVVEPGDVLLVQPARLDSPIRLPGDQPVLPDGTINLGVYGMVLVAGKTIEQIEADVTALIRSKPKEAAPPPDERRDNADEPAVVRDERITVRLVTRDSKVYYVLGEVNAPGAFQYRGRETVLDAIVAAGGLNSSASRNNIVLSRPTAPHSCRKVLPICYNEIVQLGDTSTNYQILPGDRVFVPTRGLLESLCHDEKNVCAPCGGPQTACPPPPPHLEEHPPAGGPPALFLPVKPLVNPPAPPEGQLPAPTPAKPSEEKLPPPTKDAGARSPAEIIWIPARGRS